MPYYSSDDDYASFSETDESYTRPNRHHRRSSIVKRRSPSRQNFYLSPESFPHRPHRSASTGARRRRPRDDDGVVMIGIQNDINTKQSPPSDRRHKYDGPRASAPEVIRAASPRERDWELLMDQRLLANNDVRQDIELARQQAEIDRLERQLARSRAKRHDGRHESSSRTRLADEAHWEDEIADRLRKLDRLDRLERAKRNEDEQKAAEARARVKRLEELERKLANEDEQKAANQRARFKQLEEAERRAAEEAEAERLVQEKQLKALEKQEKIRAEKERIKQEIRDEEARKLLQEQERKRELDELKSKAILEWKNAEAARVARELAEKKAKDEEFKERLKETYGLSEEEISKKLKPKEKEKEKVVEKEKELLLIDQPEQPTYIRVHRKYLLPATLQAYNLPWEFDSRDPNYFIIKKWISLDLQDELFAHTKRLRGGRLIEESSTTLEEVKVERPKRDRMFMVRKKNGHPRAWVFA